MAKFGILLVAAMLAVIVQGAEICEDPSGHLLAVRTAPGVCPAGTKIHRSAGLNIFDILWDTSSGMRTTGNFTDTLKALNDAKSSGFKYFRFFASLWGPNKAYWYNTTTRANYWSEFDKVMDAVDNSGLFAIASIGNIDYELLVNETLNDLVLNEESQSRKIATTYFTEIVTRYSSRKSILLWELGNELNLRVNIPAPTCSPTQRCFNTTEMNRYSEALVNVIRSLDHDRPISSGFSAPRPSAWHLEHCPVKGQCAADPGSDIWTLDSIDQWREALISQNHAVDIVSVHDYSKACFFNASNCGTLEAIVQGADAVSQAGLGQLFYVGEYGNSSLRFTTPADRVFPENVLSAQVKNVAQSGVFALSSIWAWECKSHEADMGCIWPHSAAGSDEMVQIMQWATAAMQQAHRPLEVSHLEDDAIGDGQ